MDYDMTNPYEIAKYIKEAKKATPVKVYVKGKNLDSLTYPEGVDAFVESRTGILFGDWKEVKPFLDEHAKDFDAVRIENEALRQKLRSARSGATL